MFLRYSFLWKWVFIILDLIVLNFSFFATKYIVSQIGILQTIIVYKETWTIINLLWVLLVVLFNIYDTNFKFIKITKDIFKQFAIYFFLVITYLYLDKEKTEPNLFIYLFFGGLLFGLLFFRYLFILLYAIFGFFRINDINVIILGNTYYGNEIARLLRNIDSGCNLLGFYDDIENVSSLTDDEKILHVLSYAKLNNIKEIYITFFPSSSFSINSYISEAENCHIRIRFIPDLNSFLFSKANLNLESGIPIISFRKEPLSYPKNAMIKRTFDILFSLIVITFILSWVIPIIAFIIKISSKGPVFYKQERWGINNKKITCLKFRTMIDNKNNEIDENGVYRQATRNDARVTEVGKVLRKTSIDELPQFINVLFGDLSIVGPRPHPVPLNIASMDIIENYLLRHSVKPGITGSAQVNGYRGETKSIDQMQKRINFDIWYLENWSLLLDLKIILKTVLNIFLGEKNVY